MNGHLNGTLLAREGVSIPSKVLILPVLGANSLGKWSPLILLIQPLMQPCRPRWAPGTDTQLQNHSYWIV